MDFKIIDKDDFIFDGILYKIDMPRPPVRFVEDSAQKSVSKYKQEVIDKGLAFGMIDQTLETSSQDEATEQEVLDLYSMDPVAVAQGLVSNPFEAQEEAEVIDPSLATFQILDMLYDPIHKRIAGRIQLLNTPSGNVAREKVKKNMKMYVSNSAVEDVVDRNRTRQDKFVLHKKIVKIIGNWRISFAGRGGEYGF